jgi:DNA-binding MarR family transcriptional regulator
MYYLCMAKTNTKTLADNRVLPLLEHLARVGRRVFETTLAPGDLRPRHLIALNLLSEHGPASQQMLADALSLDPSNVVGLLNELEERGLIARRRDPADRRRHIVELSPRAEDELALPTPGSALSRTTCSSAWWGSSRLRATLQTNHPGPA